MSAIQIPGTTADLITATQELLGLPFRDNAGGVFASYPLPTELRELASQEEDIFLAQFKKGFGMTNGQKDNPQPASEIIFYQTECRTRCTSRPRA